MLKQRVIAFLPVRDGVVVQSIGFRKYLPVGKPHIAVEFLNQWGIDEIVLVDIGATVEGRTIDLDLVRRVSRVCFVPLTIGGGLRSVDDMTAVLRSGADKVAINTAAFHTPELITLGAETFGAQCIVVSIDVKYDSSSRPEAVLNSGRTGTGLGPTELARKAEKFGAGEILLNSVDRDGSKSGFDLTVVADVAAAVSIPVIACGGAGHPRDFADVLRLPNISAAAAGNYFHFSEHSVITTKGFLRGDRGDLVRLDTYADYHEFAYDEAGRIARKRDAQLEELFFEYHPKEVI